MAARPDRDAPVTLALDDPRWTAFVAASAAATPFHHPAWARLLARAYDYPGWAVVICDAGGRAVAGAPFLEVRGLSGRRRWVSLPFTDECAPLARDARAGRDLAGALGALGAGRRAPGLEVRGAVEGVGWRTAAGAVIHVLDLGAPAEQVRARFSRSQVVRGIARAEREGVAVRRARSADDLQRFYELHTRTRRRQGVPVQPRRFFSLLWSDLVGAGLAHILLAEVGTGGPVAGALFLTWNGTTIYKFGASDPASWPRRPNHAILWTAIREACERGDRRLDLGRSDLANAGLRSFKSGWGARERPLAYSSLDPGAGRPAEGLAARALGAAIRRGPEWVCRAAGATLYRYAGSR